MVPGKLQGKASMKKMVEDIGGTTEEQLKGSYEEWSAAMDAAKAVVAALKTSLQMLKAACKRQAAQSAKKQKLENEKAQKAAEEQEKKVSSGPTPSQSVCSKRGTKLALICSSSLQSEMLLARILWGGGSCGRRTVGLCAEAACHRTDPS